MAWWRAGGIPVLIGTPNNQICSTVTANFELWNEMKPQNICDYQNRAESCQSMWLVHYVFSWYIIDSHQVLAAKDTFPLQQADDMEYIEYCR